MFNIIYNNLNCTNINNNNISCLYKIIYFKMTETLLYIY